ncbi:biotin carboxylase N-terminal domain-containing protein [Streptomyces sp. DG2A-72]|uniref:acetyl-CoA carboxylase biotin carboxylase subunit n=1 Tax=Streptomyces sp. DG2A-72 TaxID=3051386 RepID=UPI00265C07DD|nr:biotin carboxylase N-terminal domain-containing protein [Streptomyces sp. DG2A-72]MDO0935438.1 biotin carboxylase N-terminal domain-containing protein [Streptomyces sp. DG2A-72]
MIESLLIANRGEIARRIIRTARRLGIRTIAVHSDVDAGLPFVAEADEAVEIGPAAPAESYRNADRVLRAALKTGAAAIHPGYGFLSENAEFARRVRESGLVWVGPDPEVIDLMGDKINARNAVAATGMPVAPGTVDPVTDEATAVVAAADIGYPIMVKASAGGGGMGMGIATDEAELRKQYTAVSGFAARLFGDPGILLERYYPDARHIEVQILGLADGTVVALGERNCSVQRRNQKLVEESPSPALDPSLRERMLTAAAEVGKAVGYRNAGTVECLVYGETGAQDFVFLEMNTRLQVEHPVTEAVFGVDLVEEQLRVASGLPPTVDLTAVQPRGHAVEFRVNAEDPIRFLPGPGAVAAWVEPTGEGVRVDSGYAEATKVTPAYDSLMAKLIVHADSREEALARARDALASFAISGPKNNLPFFTELLDEPAFADGTYTTGLVTRMRAPRQER